MTTDLLDLPITDSQADTDDGTRYEFASVICYRDPADVRTMRRQSELMLLCLGKTIEVNGGQLML
jgi:hypothetical protein